MILQLLWKHDEFLHRERYVLRIVSTNDASQTCAFSRAVLMAGTIAAVLRLSAKNHLGLTGGLILIVLSRNVATCTIVPVVQSTLHHVENHRPGYSSFHSTGQHKSPSTSTTPTFILESLIRCATLSRQQNCSIVTTLCSKTSNRNVQNISRRKQFCRII